MSNTQFCLCLCCGAPFQPNSDDGLSFDEVGNLSLMYIQKMFRTDRHMLSVVENPLFMSRLQNTHMVHKSQHQMALSVIMEREGTNCKIGGGTTPMLYTANTNRGPFPGVSNPQGSSVNCYLATWDEPVELNFKRTFEEVESLNGIAFDWDLNFTLHACSVCNLGMTMKHWFCKILLDDPTQCLIKHHTIKIYDTRNKNVKEYRNWQIESFSTDPLFSVPEIDNTSLNQKYLGAGVGYYLCRCLKYFKLKAQGPPSITLTPHQKKLYLLLCWILLEILCLIREFQNGTMDAEKKRGPGSTTWARCCHNIRGAIELYASLYTYLILRHEYNKIYVMDFRVWHQFYAAEISKCERFKREFEGNTLVSDLLKKNISSDSDSESNLMTLEKNVKKILRMHRMVAEFIHTGSASASSSSTSILNFFLDADRAKVVDDLSKKGDIGSFDSRVRLVGIHAMMSRFMMLSKEVPDSLMEVLNSFVKAWRAQEIENVKAHGGYPRGLHEREVYYMAMLLNKLTPDEVLGMSFTQRRALAQRLRKSVWRSALDLGGTGAFTYPKEEIYRAD